MTMANLHLHIKKAFVVVATIFVLALFCSDSYSQNAGPTKDPLSEILPLVGTWKVQAEKRLSAQGPWETSAGRATITKAVGSTVIEEDLYGTLEGKPFITKTLIAFNKSTQKFQRAFADSEHGVLVDYEGEKQGESIVFDKYFVYPNKSTVKLRVVYKIISKDEFRVENMRMPERETVWDVTGRFRYMRKK